MSNDQRELEVPLQLFEDQARCKDWPKGELRDCLEEAGFDLHGKYWFHIDHANRKVMFYQDIHIDEQVAVRSLIVGVGVGNGGVFECLPLGRREPEVSPFEPTNHCLPGHGHEFSLGPFYDGATAYVQCRHCGKKQQC